MMSRNTVAAALLVALLASGQVWAEGSDPGSLEARGKAELNRAIVSMVPRQSFDTTPFEFTIVGMRYRITLEPVHAVPGVLLTDAKGPGRDDNGGDWPIASLMSAHVFHIPKGHTSPNILASDDTANDAADNVGVWRKTSSGCDVFFFDLHPNVVITWSGSCVSGRTDGIGHLIAAFGLEVETYDGGMKDGQLEGHGIIHWKDGKTIEGEFHRGVIFGTVTYREPNGFRYDGSWVNGRQEGHGTAVWAQGGRYDGDWHNGQRDGHGILIWPSGMTYDGTWHNGKKEGFGRETYPGGTTYEGYFRDNVPNGHGVMSKADFGRYEGDFKDGNMEGKGIMADARGNRFEGQFHEGEPEGEGIYISIAGSRYEGHWSHNKPNGYGTLTKSDGTIHSGEWKHGCLKEGDHMHFLLVKEEVCRNNTKE